MNKLVEEFLSYLYVERGLAENTIISYRRDLTNFLQLLNNYNILEIKHVKREHITSYLIYLKEEKRAATTIARHVAALKTFFKFLYQENYIVENIAYEIERPKQGKILPKFLSFEEVNRLLEAPILNSPARKIGRASCRERV